MPEGFEITPDMLNKASVDASNVRESSINHINQLRSQLDQLQSAWQGQAATAFQSLVQRFNDASNKILADLQTISESLATSAKEYGHREEETNQVFTQAGGQFEF
ncbi:MAG: WXG100 family type VII secretion target [Kibdelosporangium sp.]